MQTVSDAFRSAIVQSHSVSVRAEVFSPIGAPGQVAPAAAAFFRGVLDVIDGTVTIDRSQSFRRRCTLRCTQPDGAALIFGTLPSDRLNVYGNEIRLYRGIEYGDGSTERVPLGVFAISDVDVDDSGDTLEITITGYDRARKVSRAKLIDPYVVAAGTNYATAIQDLIISRVELLEFAFMSTSLTTPALTLDVGADPWEAARKWAAAIGAEVFFDAGGVCVLQPVADPATAPVVWTYQEGVDATFVKLRRSLSNENSPNHWIVTGESTTGAAAPVRGEWFDDDENSPTYLNGEYGDVVAFHSSELITSTAQANAVAEALGRSSLGATESVAFSSIVNPAHDVHDVIEIIRSRVGITDRYVIDALTIPLSAESAMEAVMRKRHVA